MADTPWSGGQAKKLYLQSGQFTSTLKDSTGALSGFNPVGITFDNTNSPACHTVKLYLQSGQFTTTVKTSHDISAIDTRMEGASYDGADTPWVGRGSGKLYLQSGQYTSTLKTSQAIGTVDAFATGISYDGTNTPWIGFGDSKLYLQSGQFTSTLKDSTGGLGTEYDISWDGTNTPWIADGTEKLYLQSGQFTSTIKTSQGIGVIDTFPFGICTNDFTLRTSGAPAGVDPIVQRIQIPATVKIVPSRDLIIRL